MLSFNFHVLVYKFQMSNKYTQMIMNQLIFAELYSWIKKCCSFVGVEN